MKKKPKDPQTLVCSVASKSILKERRWEKPFLSKWPQKCVKNHKQRTEFLSLSNTNLLWDFLKKLFLAHVWDGEGGGEGGGGERGEGGGRGGGGCSCCGRWFKMRDDVEKCLRGRGGERGRRGRTVGCLALSILHNNKNSA